MFKYDESALDLYRRLYCSPFHVCFDRKADKTEIIDYGELVEVQTQLGAMTEAVLDTAINYSNACETGAIIHISTAGNLHNSLLHGKVQLQRYAALAMMDANDRLKGITVSSLSQLLAVMEILISTLGGISSLIIFEGLNPLLLTQKCLDGSLQQHSLVFEFVASLSKLAESQNVIILWFATALPRNTGGLRESTNRDPLSVLWKEKCRRVVQHTSGV